MAINHIKFIIQTFYTKISLSIMIIRFFKYNKLEVQCCTAIAYLMIFMIAFDTV